MRRCLKNNNDYEHDHDYARYYVREKLTPVRSQTIKVADPYQPIHVKRKLLQEVPVGKVVMRVIEDIVLPYIKLNLKNVAAHILSHDHYHKDRPHHPHTAPETNNTSCDIK